MEAERDILGCSGMRNERAGRRRPRGRFKRSGPFGRGGYRRSVVRVEPVSESIADAILSHAADMNADLIVMGAYGHSRWAERVLGRATRGLLASMTVPVLMSH